MGIVYTLQNGKKMNASAFCRYLYRKIEKTSGKLGIKKEGNVERTARGSSIYCLDDAAIEIIYSLMANKKTKTKKSPFLFCLKKELELYGKLKHIKLKFIEYNGLKLEIQNMFGALEKQHKEIKYSIVNAFLQLKEL